MFAEPPAPVPVSPEAPPLVEPDPLLPPPVAGTATDRWCRRPTRWCCYPTRWCCYPTRWCCYPRCWFHRPTRCSRWPDVLNQPDRNCCTLPPRASTHAHQKGRSNRGKGAAGHHRLVLTTCKRTNVRFAHENKNRAKSLLVQLPPLRASRANGFPGHVIPRRALRRGSMRTRRTCYEACCPLNFFPFCTRGVNVEPGPPVFRCGAGAPRGSALPRCRLGMCHFGGGRIQPVDRRRWAQHQFG